MRNQVLHANCMQDYGNVVNWSQDYQADFYAANVVEDDIRKVGGLNPARWQPPSEGCYKLNTNAALSVQSQQVGLGMVIRNQNG